MDTREMIMMVVTFVLNLVGMPNIYELLKQWLGDTGKTKLVAGVLAVVVGILELVLNGQFSFSELTLENLSVAFTIVFVPAAFWYQLFTSKGVDSFWNRTVRRFL